MKKVMDKKISYFRRTVLIYFILIGAAAMIFCSYYLYETSGYQVKLQNYIIAAIVFSASITAILILFMRNIITPMEQISRALGEAAKKLSQGHLDLALPVFPGNDVNKIGEYLNDFTVNVQEVLLHVQTHSNFIIKTIEQIKQKLGEQNNAVITPQIERDFTLARQHIQNIQEMIQAFEYYDICLENGKVMSGNTQSASKTQAGCEAEKEKHP
ncbi:HAMP domain-containing protein [Desulfonema limicola]|uniref:HAMP domain-containing protein n=2 Tax=Desulfonema limicola TaxID=45656 RepID=A0A975GEJ9_9BACT|nr:HAMP domain-containing protein [Desulfonema limicola]